MIHAPVQNFFGNWLWWHACALAHNTARWVRVLALPASFHRCRGKRLRLAFFNVAARVVHHARQVLSGSRDPTRGLRGTGGYVAYEPRGVAAAPAAPYASKPPDQ